MYSLAIFQKEKYERTAKIKQYHNFIIINVGMNHNFHMKEKKIIETQN